MATINSWGSVRVRVTIPRSNLVSATMNRDGIIQAIAYAYDSANQLTEIIYPDGRIVDYTRNVIGQIVSATTTFGGTTTTLASSIGYEPFGPVADIAYGNGITNTRTYDLDYRLTDLVTAGGSVYQELAYTLDNANNITHINNQLDNSRSQGFGYDNLNRLTHASDSYGSLDYNYDAIGNRLSENHDGQVMDYSYDSVSHHLLQTGGTVTYSYDANGNTLSDTAHDFNYGDNNRLKQASVGGSPVADYVYNGRGERVKKTDIAATYYQYDQGGQLIAETDAIGNTLREYAYVNGMPLATIENGNIYTIHPDHLGTPQLITDENQQIVWQADYEPFGKTSITTASIENNLRFPGQYYDQESGLHYNHFRDYDASLGSYLQPDPIGIMMSRNLYTYTNQNPIRFIDFTGLFKCPSGIWSARSSLSVSAFIGGGITLDDITYTCESNQKKCSATAMCFGGGAALTIGVGFVPKGRIEGVTDSNEFQGYSSGFYIAGGPFSNTITSSTATTGIGKSWLIGAFAFISCTNFHLRCDEGGCK